MSIDKDKLLMVIDSVQVYSEERIEIVWKMNDGFFSEVAGEKELVTFIVMSNPAHIRVDYFPISKCIWNYIRL